MKDIKWGIVATLLLRLRRVPFVLRKHQFLFSHVFYSYSFHYSADFPCHEM